jgi:hypothetical protein
MSAEGIYVVDCRSGAIVWKSPGFAGWKWLAAGAGQQCQGCLAKTGHAGMLQARGKRAGHQR